MNRTFSLMALYTKNGREGMQVRFGCHLSIREGYLGAAKRAAAIGAAAYQYFPKNPRALSIKDFDELDAKNCKEYCLENNLTTVAHTPYPTSLTPPEEKKDMIIKSLLNDLLIADTCGSEGVVVHYGSQISKSAPLASYQLMIEMLNLVLSKWDGECKILLENNAGKPGSIGTTIEELVQVRNLSTYPEKIGFCLDTCHAFASGLWTGDNTDEFIAKSIDLGYLEHLKVVHFNNCRYPVESGIDRHANIFKNGFITEQQFGSLVHAKGIKELPFILETPSNQGVTHKEEIKQLYTKWG